VRALAVEMHLDVLQELPFVRELTGKMLQTKAPDQTLCRRAILCENFQVKWRSLCEPAWSKCNWTFYKNHFTGKFTAKMPEPRWSTLIEHWGYSFRKNRSVWIHCLGNSHPVPIARCFSLTAAVKLFFLQRFRNAHGVLDQAANGCKRLWVVAAKQGFWPKTTWRVTCSKRYTSS
jgi:hypothetical protein